MDYQLLEEIECPEDLFAFDDDISHTRVNSTNLALGEPKMAGDGVGVTNGDIASSTVEYRPLERKQNPLKRSSLFMEESFHFDSSTHDGLDSFLLGNDTSQAQTPWQARSLFQTTFKPFSPAGEGMRYQLLEEIKCPDDLFVFDDDASNSQLNETVVLTESLVGVENLPVVSDVSIPAVERGSSNDQRSGLEKRNPATKKLFSAGESTHEQHDEFLFDSGISPAQPSLQTRLPFQARLQTSTPIDHGDTIEEKDTGKRVAVTKIGVGVLRYVGPVKGKAGIFCGVELDHPLGRHDGTYQGVVYFQCADMHGIFAPPHRVQLLIEMPKPLQRGKLSCGEIASSTSRMKNLAQKPKSTLKTTAASRHPPNESNSKLRELLTDYSALVAKTREGGPVMSTAQSATPPNAKRRRNEAVKMNTCTLASSLHSSTPRRKQRRSLPRPTTLSDKRKKADFVSR